MSEWTTYPRFFLWAAAGAVLGIFALVFGVIGIAVLIVGAIVAGRRRWGGTSLGGYLSGLALPLLWVTYVVGAVERVCSDGTIDLDGVQTCTRWESTGSIRWPWLLAAVVAVLVGVGLHRRARRREAELVAAGLGAAIAG